MNPFANVNLGVPTDKEDLFALLIEFLPRLFQSAIYLLVGLIVIKIIDKLFAKVLKAARVNETLVEFLTSMGKAVLIFMLSVIVLFKLGLGTVATAVSSVVALFSFGIGLGAQGIIADIIAGTFLATEKRFRVGARVIAGSKQSEGVIEAMDFRKVRVRDDSGRLHVLPNADVEKNEFTVIEKDDKIKKVNKGK